MNLTAIAIDDEPMALEVIKKFSEKTTGLDLVGTFQNPLEASAFLQEHQVDLVFLDIRMPDLTGPQFLQSLSQLPMVIFTTAHPEYAVDSYEWDAVDYLMKPIPLDRFLKAVNKAIAQKKAEDLLQEKQEEGADRDYLFIKSDTRFFRVNYEDILFLEGMRDYVAVHTPQQRILTLTSMTNILKKLPSDRFMRVHKSYIIGLQHITLIQNNKVIIGDREIPISNSYKDDLAKFIEGQA